MAAPTVNTTHNKLRPLNWGLFFTCNNAYRLDIAGVSDIDAGIVCAVLHATVPSKHHQNGHRGNLSVELTLRGWGRRYKKGLRTLSRGKNRRKPVCCIIGIMNTSQT